MLMGYRKLGCINIINGIFFEVISDSDYLLMSFLV